MINKLSLTLFLLSLVSLNNPSLGYPDGDCQKKLYMAIQQKNVAEACYALENLKACPIFVIPIEGTRTMKQINALNFALRMYKEEQNDSVLRVILQELTPISFQNILEYQDQLEQKTPQDLAEELFPDEEDVHAFLGKYIKRRHGSIDAGL